ncbi:hypothetical protein [Nocardia goodfellowii]|uniref:DUF2993 domain-containing protein n=1 Tax=Nocardia goodfellowii TaxID=882446 RepID=A0ABS4QBH2_9NOCA|nr:hypothetical protein [Nocardia goodfellowii]MBP2189045.1 hypothetical protein [Nocardia goodfellowii]
MPGSGEIDRRRRLKRVTTLRPKRPPSTRQRIAGRVVAAVTGLGRTSKVVIGLAVAALVSGVVGLVMTNFGPALGDALRSGPEIRVAVHHGIGRVGNIYVLPGRLAGEPDTVPTAAADLRKLLVANQATIVGPLRVKIVLEGARTQTVSILDIAVRVVEKKPALNGTLLRFPLQGAEQNLDACVDLSSTAPRVVKRGEDGACPVPGRSFFDGTRIDLKLGEQYIVDVEVEPMAPEPEVAASYKFEFIITGVASGKLFEMTVGNSGSPFSVSDYADRYGAVYTPVGDINVVKKVDAAQFCSPTCSRPRG